MKLTQKSGATIAMTAAALIVSGASLISPAAVAGEKGQCLGVNACKGKSDCKTAKSECKGHNACKGQGYLMLSKEECEQKGGKFKA